MSLSLFEVVNYVLKPKVFEEDPSNPVLTLTGRSTVKDFKQLDRNHNKKADLYFFSLFLLVLEDSDTNEDCRDLLLESAELISKNSEYLNTYCESFDNILISKTNSCKDLDSLLDFCEVGNKVETRCISLFFEYKFLYKSVVSLRISNDLCQSLRTICQNQDFDLISKGLKILEKAYISRQNVFDSIFLFFSVVLDVSEDFLLGFQSKEIKSQENHEKLELIANWVALMTAVQNKSMDQKTRIFNLKKKLRPILEKFGIGYSTIKAKHEPEIILSDVDKAYENSNIKLIEKSLLSYQSVPIFAISRKDFQVGIHLGEYNKQKIVVKAYSVTQNIDSVRQQIENEIKVYQILSEKQADNNNFLKYYGSIFEGSSIKMVMDYCENNLMDYIEHLKETSFQFQESQFSMISYKLVNSFHIMAELGIFHQDIKPHNMLVDSHWNIKIIDFNVSLIKPQDFTIFGTGAYPLQGTSGYLSPELQRMIDNKQEKQEFNPEKSDVYSLGLVLFQMLTYEKVQGLSHEKLKKTIENLEFISVYSKTYLCKMLEFDPSQRPKFREVLPMIPFDPRTFTGSLPFK